MRKIFILFLIASLFIACNNNKTNKKVITVSIAPQKFFVEQIADTIFDIQTLIPVGAAPATYEPTAKQLINLNNSIAYFRIGHIGFEQAWMSKIKDNNPQLNIIDCSKETNLIYAKAHRHGDHVHLEGVDPHIWLSPKSVRKQAEIILNSLINISPENSKLFNANFNKFLSKIDSVDTYITNATEKIKGAKFIIFHPALTYFARDYNLVQVPMEMDGKTPSPVYIKEIIDLAKQNDIHTVFIQKEFDSNNAQLIAKEINGKVIQIEPLMENWIKNITEITDQIVTSTKNK